MCRCQRVLCCDRRYTESVSRVTPAVVPAVIGRHNNNKSSHIFTSLGATSRCIQRPRSFGLAKPDYDRCVRSRSPFRWAEGLSSRPRPYTSIDPRPLAGFLRSSIIKSLCAGVLSTTSTCATLRPLLVPFGRCIHVIIYHHTHFSLSFPWLSCVVLSHSRELGLSAPMWDSRGWLIITVGWFPVVVL